MQKIISGKIQKSDENCGAVCFPNVEAEIPDDTVYSHLLPQYAGHRQRTNHDDGSHFAQLYSNFKIIYQIICFTEANGCVIIMSLRSSVSLNIMPQWFYESFHQRCLAWRDKLVSEEKLTVVQNKVRK